ncbi:MAG: hypothetical protein KDA84_24245 [Planctomycetaceae bacterium]|nr:hypothetical protein [Planctomycetaceae bacterium]
MTDDSEMDPVLEAIDEWLLEITCQQDSTPRNKRRAVFGAMREYAHRLRILCESERYEDLKSSLSCFHRWINDSMPWEGQLYEKAHLVETAISKAIRVRTTS